MAFSKQVATVIGMCCLSQEFRNGFFHNPEGTAEGLVGRLTDEEIGYVKRVAGKAGLPPSIDKGVYVNRLHVAFTEVDAACSCPMPPCPDPNNFR
jgi:hypothetical protein